MKTFVAKLRQMHNDPYRIAYSQVHWAILGALAEKLSDWAWRKVD